MQEERMLGKVAKMVAYAKAPGKTFMVLHPMRALKMGAAYFVVKMVVQRNRGHA